MLLLSCVKGVLHNYFFFINRKLSVLSLTYLIISYIKKMFYIERLDKIALFS